MKKKSNIYLIVFLLMVAIIIVVGFFIDKKNKKEIAEEHARSINNMYTKWLHIKGDFSYEGNKVKAENLEYNDKLLMVDVSIYNYDKNEQLSIKQLYEEYVKFRNGESKEKYKNLNEYVKFIYEYCRVGCDYEDYCDSIDDELGLIREEKQRNGEDVSTKVYIQSATIEELQEAINRVNQRGDSE